MLKVVEILLDGGSCKTKHSRIPLLLHMELNGG